MEFELTKNQQQIFDTVESSLENILITGKPGVGKSVLINSLVEHGNKTYTLAAPTGLAALNIGGKTLHSLFGIPVSSGVFTENYNNFTDNQNVINNVRYQIKHLIIDEVSMVRADVFDYIDRFCRFAKEVDKPFGGIQIIIVGDFFQLPPVIFGAEQVQLREAGYVSPFVFDSNIFETAAFRTLQLNQVLRQKGDNKFLKLLDSARAGKIGEQEISALNKRIEQPNDLRIQLVSTNKEADAINQGHLRGLEGESKKYCASSYGQWPADPVDKELTLKVGAHVMVKVNGADRPEGHRGPFESEVVNGTLGKVVELDEQWVKIEIGEKSAQIYRKRWERKVKQERDGKWEEQVVASFEQMPLQLAWAISIHKSQGQSFDQAHIDPNRIFAAGQMYVALSRVRSLKGVTLERAAEQRHFKTNNSVLRFYASLCLALLMFCCAPKDSGPKITIYRTGKQNQKQVDSLQKVNRMQLYILGYHMGVLNERHYGHFDTDQFKLDSAMVQSIIK